MLDYEFDEDVEINISLRKSTSIEELARELNLSELVIARVKDAIEKTSQPAAIVLAKLGIASDDEIARAISKISKCEIIGEDNIPNSALTIDDLSPIFLMNNKIIPIYIQDDLVCLGMADTNNEFAISALELLFEDRKIIKYVLPIGLIENAISNLYHELKPEFTDIAGDNEYISSDVETLRSLASEEPIIKLLDSLLADAIDNKATDLHIETKQSNILIRIRVDGRLRIINNLGIEYGPPLISRLKILSELDVANSRSPQDGRASITNRGKKIDIRVSTVPTAFGESVAVRILDRSVINFDFDNLGIVGKNKEKIIDLIRQKHGLTIITGPTGSGKTTSLYAALDMIRDSSLKILTIEDPIEFRFEEVNQVQVNNAAGVSFASALRSFLRQDPDIILVGEIRDSETAQIAVQAALTGHLVLATLHTNDAASAPSRLIDMGVEPYLLSSVLNGCAAQRLVRRLCNNCKTKSNISTKHKNILKNYNLNLNSENEEFYYPVGCSECNHTGYKGRLAIFEAFSSSEEVRTIIHELQSLDTLKSVLNRNNFQSLFQDGYNKASNGLTSLEEIINAANFQDSLN